MRNIGRRAAHVEADDPVEPGTAADLGHGDNAASWTREDRVAAMERSRICQPARRRHELQTGELQTGRIAANAGANFLPNAVHIAA